LKVPGTASAKKKRSARRPPAKRAAQPTHQRRALEAFVESLRRLQPIDEVARQIVQRIVSGFDVAWCGLLLRDDARARLSLARMHGASPDPLTSIPLDDSHLHILNRHHRPFRVPDSDNWSEWRRRGVVFALPLFEEDRWIGLILIGDRSAAWSRTDVALLNTLRRRAGVAIDSARRYSAAIQSRNDLASVFEASLVASSMLDLRGALERLAEHITHALGMDGVTLSAWDRERDHLINWLGHRRKPFGPPDALGSIQPLSGMPAAREALNDRRPRVISSIHTQTHPAEARWLNDHGIAQMLLLPLVARDAVIGLARLYTLDLSRTFEPIDMQLAQTLSTQAAVSIDNARLIEELRDAARTLEHKVADRTEELERTLRHQQIEASKTQAMIESVRDGVVVVDPAGTLILVNAAAEDILGRPRGQLLGLRLHDLGALLHESALPWVRAMQEWLGGDSTHEEQIELGERIISAILSPVSLGGEAQGLVNVLRDVSRDVEINRAKSAFVSIVSHELRTPMTAMKGYVDMILKEMVGPVGEEQRNFLNVIRDNIDRLTSLVNDLLDISHIETGRMRLKLERVSLSQAVSDVTHTLYTRLQEKGHSLEVRVPDSLPPVRVDNGRLTQILTNLIANAIAYTPPGGRISVSARADDLFAVVEVSDTGVGIPPEEQRRVFESFFRGDNPLVRDARGTGLGLPIVQSLVEMHGGRIWLQSDGVPGRGTTFSFTLPLWEIGEQTPLDVAVGETQG
jgi:PAS domain S-box-containing protein